LRLYVGQDELKNIKALTASLGRSVAKETLDYTKIFSERRGMPDALGMRNEIALGQAPNSLRMVQ
jgi:hypothetical protein